MTTSNVYITDKNGGKHFNTLCGAAYAMSEVRNLKQKLKEAHMHPEAYHFIDVATASVMVDGECGDCLPQAMGVYMSDDELLAELGV